MNLEQQVCSLELAKKLKELGVKQESYWYWAKYFREDKRVLVDWVELANDGKMFGIKNYEEYYSAFTVAELGEMLPEIIDYKMPDREMGKATYFQDKDIIAYEETYSGQNFRVHFEWIADTEADARAKMVIYLKEKR